MNNKAEILAELQKIGPVLKNIGNDVPYKVPEHYFEKLPDTILQSVSAKASFEENMAPLNPYGVDSQYFDGLSASIMSRIAQKDELKNELEAVAPFLNTISKETPYRVADDYFDRLQPLPPKHGSVIRPVFFRRYTHYAVAAVITAVLLVGAYVLISPTSNVSLAEENVVMQKARHLSEAEIANFLQSSLPIDSTLTFSKTTSTIELEISRNVTQMSDQEIQQYLSETGDVDEI